jgi:hypothetical protein
MPFESGLFWGCLSYGKRGQKAKKIMILDSIPFRYQQTLSDIAGQDIKDHNNDPKKIMDIVRTWLGNKTDKVLPGGEEMWKHYLEFERDLPAICANLSITLDEMMSSSYFTSYISVIVSWLKSKNYSS